MPSTLQANMRTWCLGVGRVRSLPLSLNVGPSIQSHGKISPGRFGVSILSHYTLSLWTRERDIDRMGTFKERHAQECSTALRCTMGNLGLWMMEFEWLGGLGVGASHVTRTPGAAHQLPLRLQEPEARALCAACPGNGQSIQGGGKFRRGTFPRGKFRTSNWCGIFPIFFQCRCGTFPVRINGAPAAPSKHIR